ncbi:hypothetical protein [Candidatus Neptunichlamydia sp. REUL1]|uniref:hypothetical protein n=1 Tax=Candidatus Neptunichlamydia sp. REUL1 TaxID=3064277 RepID=UPI002931729A|nr:hypothetical protein [Candidatus Neptunochlamydia sp. REUL1]
MMFLRTLSLAFIFSSSLMASFENNDNHRSGEKITGIQICGERCSGTNFLESLIKNNFPKMHPNFHSFGWKHFLCWFETPLDKEHFNLPDRMITLEGSEQYLFIVIVRDPYNWIRSFYLNPHHVSPELTNKGFFHFISSEWRSEDCSHIDSFNPYTGAPFKNVLELRKYKTVNYLKIANLVGNFCLVRYEEVSEHPKQFVDFIADFYGLEKCPQFTPIIHYKGYPHNPAYKKQPYFPFENKDLLYINQNIDWDVENRLGYTKHY